MIPPLYIDETPTDCWDAIAEQHRADWPERVVARCEVCGETVPRVETSLARVPGLEDRIRACFRCQDPRRAR